MSARSIPRPLIAVVEDDPHLRDSLRFALVAQGYDVRPFAAAVVCLAEASAATAPDGLILDYDLPDMDGLTLLRRLRDAGVRCPAILAARDPNGPSAQAARDLGATVVSKSLMGDALGEVVRRLVPAA